MNDESLHLPLAFSAWIDRELDTHARCTRRCQRRKDLEDLQDSFQDAVKYEGPEFFGCLVNPKDPMLMPFVTSKTMS